MYRKQRYSVQYQDSKTQEWFGWPHSSYDTIEEAYVRMVELAFAGGWRFRVRDRWNKVKEE